MPVSIHPRDQYGIIDVALVDGIRAIPARAYGHLAVHRATDEQPNEAARWTITHIPTGLSVIARLDSLDRAQRMASELQKLDWEFDDPVDLPDTTRETLLREYGNHWRDGRPDQYGQWRKIWHEKINVKIPRISLDTL